MTELSIFFTLLTILVSFSGAILTYLAYRIYKLPRDWLFTTSALFLLGLQGILNILNWSGVVPNTLKFMHLNNTLLPFAIGVFLLVGLWSIIQRKHRFPTAIKKALVVLKR
jgi:hypothetical protein